MKIRQVSYVLCLFRILYFHYRNDFNEKYRIYIYPEIIPSGCIGLPSNTTSVKLMERPMTDKSDFTQDELFILGKPYMAALAVMSVQPGWQQKCYVDKRR
jgi:hypothetical protein